MGSKDDSDPQIIAEIPTSVFEEALRSIEKIQKTQKKASGAEKEQPSAAKSKEYRLDLDDDSQDLDSFIKNLAAESESQSPIEEKAKVVPIKQKPPVPNVSQATSPTAAKSPSKTSQTEALDQDLLILAKLLEEEENIHKEAEFFESLLIESKRREATSQLQSEPGVQAAEAAEASEQTVDQQALAEKESKIQELMERIDHLQQEFNKFKIRLSREKDTAVNFSNELLIQKLLPIIDNLERGLEHAAKSNDMAALTDGVQLVLRQLITVLSQEGVELIKSVGEKFDPNVHEAMSIVENTNVFPNTIVAEYQKGYKLRGRLLRPSKVVVAKKSIE